MPQVVRAETPVSSTAPQGFSPLRFPAAMVETAAKRFCWISLICAVTTVIFFTVQRWLQPEVAEAQRDPLLPLLALCLVLFSGSMIAVQRFQLLSSYTMLNVGLAFEIFVAFAISFFETSTQIAPDRQVRGCSLVAVWITVCGLLIPNTPVVTFVAALGSAAMWPIAYSLNSHLHGFDPVPLNRLAVYHFVNLTMAFWAYFLNKRIYAIELSAQKAQELGSYELVALLGTGGMGEVWRARHKLLARDAAIKLIRPEVLVSQAGRQADMARRRFEREARATANLSSPHTVSLFDFGMSQDGSFYYVMELLDGINLQTLVEKFGPAAPERVVHILHQVCDSLEEAHRAGLVHRDIKPTNLHLCALGMNYDFVKVLDFGLVKDVGGEQATLVSVEGMAAGTPAYMSPEAALGEREIDGRADVYSLGCVAYYLLTRCVVFSEPTATATVLAHVQKTPVPPSQKTEQAIPADLEGVVMACLAKQPEERPRSAQELQRRLELLECAGRWTRAEAARWWQTHLPVTSAERSGSLSEAARMLVAKR